MAELSKLAEAVKLINSKFKDKETGDVPIPSGNTDIPIMSSGIIGIDYASNCGGIPEGRIFEVFGAESSGKTTIALLIAKKYAELGKTVAFIDVEQAFNKAWARKLGVPVDDPEKFVLVQNSVFEDIFGMIRVLMEQGGVSLIIVDSVAAISTQDDFDQEEAVGKGMPIFAKNFRRQLRILTPIAAKTKCNLLFLNHSMQDLGKMGWGDKTTTPGGTALKYLSSMRLKVARIQTEKDKEGNKIANRVEVSFVKNKIAAPYGKGSFLLDFERGVDHVQELMDYSLELGIIIKKGSRDYQFNDNKIADSQEKFYNYIKDNEDFSKQLQEEIYNRMKTK